ncbi:TraX family protein [Paenibacillus sp. YYML68]|uniref:TraX family protein n=1 Tax=Paenibacillus sp. YYML68 TaxID=2909250 RepID=UPI0024916311|nr:TraX family protein [Paenibacillus sp. YYML68]
MWQWIAMITMTLDHIGHVFYPDQLWWRMIGRLAFPIYAYLLVQGYQRTSDVPRYMRRLLFIFAVAQLPYMALFQTLELNVVGTLLLSLLVLWALDKPRTSMVRYVWIAVCVGLLYAVEFDYGLYGLTLVLIFRYIPTYWAVAAHGFATLLLFTAYPVQWFSLIATLLLYSAYLPQHRSAPVWLWRSFYPLHLLVLWIVWIMLPI